MKRIKATYFDNYNLYTEEMYNSYIEFCEINGYDIHDEDSNDYYQFVSDEEFNCWVDFMDDVTFCNLSDTKCVVLGCVGRWTGKHEVIPTVFDSLREAIYACIKGCDYYKIEQYCSSIRVTSTHHDGTNRFEIKFLNDKGYDTVNGDLSNRRYHLTLTDYLF